MDKELEELKKKAMKSVVYDLLLGVQINSRNIMEERLKDFNCPVQVIAHALELVSQHYHSKPENKHSHPGLHLVPPRDKH